MRDFISSANCSCCQNLKMRACAFFSSTSSVFVAGFCLYTDYTYSIVFTSQLNLPNHNHFHWMIGPFLVVDMNAVGSSQSNFKFSCSGHSLSVCFNQSGPVSHSPRLNWSTLMALVPMSAGLMIQFTWLHYELSVVSQIFANRLATNTCCLQWELCIVCRKVVESAQKLQLWIFDSCSLSICSCSLTVMTVACSSKRGIKKFGIDETLHFATTNAKSAEYSMGFEHKYATRHIVSSDASAKRWSSHLFLVVLKYLWSMLVSTTSGC